MRNSHYLRRVRPHILPLSVAQTLPAAFAEWQVDPGRVYEHDPPDATCELCEQEGLRFQFGIENPRTLGRLLVGSRCILRFDIAMVEGGRRLSTHETRGALRRLIKRKRVESCLRALRTLAQTEHNDVLDGAVNYFERNEHLTPKLALAVLWNLSRRQIDYDPRWFKVCTRRDRHKVELVCMPRDQVRQLWPALSASQRKYVMRHGHSAPAVIAPPPVAVAPTPLQMVGPYTYEQMVAVGWTDALLVAHGYALPRPR